MRDDFGKFFAIARRTVRLNFLLFLNNRSSSIRGILLGSRQRNREQGTVTQLLADLKWDSLQVRREKARLLMFYKATHGLVDIPLPDTLIPLSVRNTRQYHPKRFYPMFSNTKSYKGTFFPSTVAMWNSLPPSVLDKPNISQFRQALDHFY